MRPDNYEITTRKISPKSAARLLQHHLELSSYYTRLKAEGGSSSRRTEREGKTDWEQLPAEIVPTSTFLHGDFLRKIPKGSSVLDIGCGTGQKSRLVSDLTGSHVVGVDINESELSVGNSLNQGRKIPITFLKESADDLSFPNDSYDRVMLLGTLGAITKDLRSKVLSEAIRVTKKDGIVYISDFSRIKGDPIWDTIYADNERITGEYGSKIVYWGLTGRIKFIGYHFDENELKQQLEQQGLVNIQIRKKMVKSTMTDNMYECLGVWGYKK